MKAYPIARVLRERIVNDRIGETAVVLVGDPESGAVRAYRREGRAFRSGGTLGELRDEAGRTWKLTEEGLVPRGEGGVEPLPCIPGVVAFWFGWYGFYPQTEVWGN